MKTIIKSVPLFFLLVLLFIGCPSPLTVEPETTPEETPDNTPTITSSAKNISLTAQDDGILITLTKEDGEILSNVTIACVSEGIYFSNVKWTNNKAEILYPFSEGGKVSRFYLQLSRNGNYEQQTVEITATGGIGYPMTEFFNEFKLYPSYDSEANTFSVQLGTEEEELSDLLSSLLVDNGLNYVSPYLHINLFLGDRTKKTIWYGCYNLRFVENETVSGSYQIPNHLENTYLYSDYGNTYFAEMFFGFRLDDYSFEIYSKSCSDIETITNSKYTSTEIPVTSSAKNISLTAQDDGILITLTKEENFLYNSYIEDSETYIRINYNIDNLTWTDNKAEILYPFSEKDKVSRFNLILSGNGNYEQQTVEITATGGIGYPMTELFKQTKLEPSYDSDTNLFYVSLDTTAQSLTDFFSEKAKNSIDPHNVWISGTLNLGNLNRSCYYGGFSFYGTSGKPWSRQIQNSNNTNVYYSDYGNEYYALMDLRFTVNGCSFSINGNNSEVKTITGSKYTPTEIPVTSSAKNISLTAQDDGILITLTKEENFPYTSFYIEDSETHIGISDSIDSLTWTDNKAEILYPFSEKDKVSRFNIWLYYKNGTYVRQTVEITATGGIGYPLTELFKQTKLEPSYDSDTNLFYANLDTTAQSITDFFSEKAKNIIDPNDIYISGSLRLGNLSRSCHYGGFSFYGTKPWSRQIQKSNNPNVYYSDWGYEYYALMDLRCTVNGRWFGINGNNSEVKTITNSKYTSTEIPVTSSAKNISLTAQDDGILITLTKEENCTGFWLEDSETHIRFDCNIDSLTWTDNKAEILYPFSEKDKVSQFNLDLSGNVTIERQTVEITATGGIGYPLTELFKQTKIEPSYDSDTNLFYANLDTTAQSLTDFFSEKAKNSIKQNNVDISGSLRLGNLNRSWYYGDFSFYGTSGKPWSRQIQKSNNPNVYYSDCGYEYYASMNLNFKVNGYWFRINGNDSDVKTITGSKYTSTDIPVTSSANYKIE